MINAKGQTALILILLTAGALIFFSITLNWGRIAQTKSLVSLAADQAASLAASDAASYGESEKQSQLKDTNKISALSGILMDIIMVIVTIIILIISILSCGAGASLLTIVMSSAVEMAAAAVVASVATLVLTASVIQPGMNKLWNKLQANQPIQQQFFESAISTALEGASTDQVNITDYFDSNTNGLLGINGVIPNDIISRFAFFYTERLKITNNVVTPQVQFFDNQLIDFMHGETCLQNYNDSLAPPNGYGLAISQNCIDPSTNEDYCSEDVSDPNCQRIIPNGFQLNDSCTDSIPGTTNYNPYCDPCCQPMTDGNGNPLRPSSCYPYTSGYPTACAGNINATGCNTTDLINAGYGPPTQCSQNNPFGAAYPFLYDASYQEYANGKSFLDLMGRDQPMIPTSPPPVLPLTQMTVYGNFPNGVYPFFWDMKFYSPEVDNINPSSLLPDHSQDHWCVATASTTFTNPSPILFPGLTQLTLPYTCSGLDCCVNYLLNNTTNNTTGATAGPITVGAAISITVSASPSSLPVGSTLTMTAIASEPAPGAIADVSFQATQGGVVTNYGTETNTANPPLAAPYPTSTTVSGTLSIPSCYGTSNNIPVSGTYNITAIATDIYGNQSASSPVTITITNPNACSPTTNNCGTDGCGNSCGPPCTLPQKCGVVTANVCGCVPTTTQCPGGDNCGTVLNDGCGNKIPCGSCTSPKTCSVSPGSGPGVCQ